MDSFPSLNSIPGDRVHLLRLPGAMTSVPGFSPVQIFSSISNQSMPFDRTRPVPSATTPEPKNVPSVLVIETAFPHRSTIAMCEVAVPFCGKCSHVCLAGFTPQALIRNLLAKLGRVVLGQQPFDRHVDERGSPLYL